ncbi:carbon-nitrogen hydrolase family protein [Dongia sp.]|uniref:carbon-nitrogen hydrolase family protein n=1 Tax=Dongia sp. TaxID=1977262 RepID=UPI0035B340C3
MSETTLAAANVAIVHNKARNLRRFIELMEEAAAQGADLLVLPEVGLQGYADFAFALGDKGAAEQKQYYFREAETIPGPATEVIAAAARRLNMYVQVGLAESALHGNVIYNSVAFIGPEGLVGTYRKVHSHCDYPYFSPGEDAPVFETPFARIGSIICYDMCFPEFLRSYYLRGAELILNSTAWPMGGHDRAQDYPGWAMDLSAKANAFFNQAWLVISNHCEKGAYSQNVDYYGGSQIVDPYGKVVAYRGEDEGLVIHRADLRAVQLKSRTEAFYGMNLLQDRRPEHYGPVTDQSYRRIGRP